MSAHRLERSRILVKATSKIHDVKAESPQVTGSAELREDGDRRFLDKLSVEVDLATLKTGDPIKDLELRRRLGDHVGGRATFTLSAPVEIMAERAAVRGQLTFRGIARTVDVTAQVRTEGASLLGHASFTVRFTDHGLEPPKILFLKVNDVVEVRVELTAVAA